LLTHTDYQHKEIDGGAVGTTFLNRGNEGRIEASHAKLGDLTGSIGVQFSDTHSQAIGEEAFMPSTQTKKQGIYLYEELPIGKILLSGAARLDYNQMSSAGGERFGPSANVSFAPRNFSLGSQYAIDSSWRVNFNLSHAERAPAATELYAHGVHIATNQYLIGNSQLNKEISNNFEASLNWKTAKHSASFSTYYNRFSNFITGFSTGNQVDESGQSLGSLSETVIKGVPAEFKGVEAQAKFRIYEGQGDLDLNLRGDYLQATNQETGKPLPRISPMRIGTGFDYQFDRLRGNLDILHGFKQDRLAEQELSTSAYTLVNATLSYQFKSAFHLEAFAKARNLLNEDIRDHSSYLKEIAPMGGRSLLFGIRGEF
jgi:iron complex outermembrane receptor protein